MTSLDQQLFVAFMFEIDRKQVLFISWRAWINNCVVVMLRVIANKFSSINERTWVNNCGRHVCSSCASCASVVSMFMNSKSSRQRVVNKGGLVVKLYFRHTKDFVCCSISFVLPKPWPSPFFFCSQVTVQWSYWWCLRGGWFYAARDVLHAQRVVVVFDNDHIVSVKMMSAMKIGDW